MSKDDHEALLTKLRFIQNLVNDPGATDGEKENGRQLYINLLKKYGLSEADLVEEKKEISKFTYGNKYEEELLFQIVSKVIDSSKVSFWRMDPRISSRKSKDTLCFDLTKIQRKEIEFLYSIYLPELKKGLDKFVTAFIHSNRIFPETSPADTDESKLSLAELEELIRLMRSIRPTAIPRNYLMEPKGEPA